jgi:acylphosphatase
VAIFLDGNAQERRVTNIGWIAVEKNGTVVVVKQDKICELEALNTALLEAFQRFAEMPKMASVYAEK